MRLLLTYFTLIQVVVAQPLTEVTGYVGDSITLSSGANHLWKLSLIKWSIYTNTTLIATYNIKGRTNVERFYRFKRRLHLNNSTGDLTIYNLTKDDAMVYTVDFFDSEKNNDGNKINLTVKQHLQEPNIEILSRTNKKDDCWITLLCDSTDESVTISWKLDVHVKTFDTNLDGKSAFVLVQLNKTQQVEFTCNSSINTEDFTSSRTTLKCEEDQPEPKPEPKRDPELEPELEPTPPPPYRNRALSFFLGGFFAAFVVLSLLFCLRGNKLDK